MIRLFACLQRTAQENEGNGYVMGTEKAAVCLTGALHLWIVIAGPALCMSWYHLKDAAKIGCDSEIISNTLNLCMLAYSSDAHAYSVRYGYPWRCEFVVNAEVWWRKRSRGEMLRIPKLG